jgi:prepilin-type N-terminal cleavage/methylation domain-containing protein
MKLIVASKTQSQAGFTLIELLVVVIIAAVLAGIAAPGWLGMMNRQRLGAARSDITQTLRSAQQQAIQQRTPVNVTFETRDGVPTALINGFPRPVGGDGSNARNLTLQSYLVKADGTKVNRPGISFDYQGLPAQWRDPDKTKQLKVEDELIPFVVTLANTDSPNQKQCLIVINLIGSLKTATGADCDNPPVN